jgi:DNA-binding NarL/FixJ family response regulator
MTKLRMLIADDHPVFRYGMRALLGTIPDVEVVGEATRGDEVVQMAASLRPDMVLMDVHMPGLNGIEATREIMRTLPQTHVLVVTMFEDDSSVFAAMRAGARGYVLKDAAREELLRAIRAVSHGEAIFSPAIASRLMSFLSPRRAPSGEETFAELTEREREVLDLIAQGKSNAEIGRALQLSTKTVANYVSTILTKLQIADRAEAIIRARDAGMGQDTREWDELGAQG